MTAAARGALRSPSLAALLLYAAAALAMFGGPLLHPGHCTCVPGTTDSGVFAWAMAWWPHALAEGINPFFTHLIYAPQGLDLAAAGGLIPGPALALWPVTAIAGPLFSYNLAMSLSPAATAFTAFLLCRRVTRSFWPALAGGWIFGFSSYLLGEMTGHLNLALVFLVPVVVHLVLRGFDGDLSRRRFALLLALVLVGQISISLEVLATLTIFGAVALAAGWLLLAAPGRARLRSLLAPIAGGYALAVVIASPYLYYALQPGGLPVLTWRTDKFSSDLLGIVVPSGLHALGGSALATTSRTFTAGRIEGGTYFGLGLLAIVALALWAGRRRPGVRVLGVTMFAAWLLSLGGQLHVGGDKSVPLPWALVHRLPVLGLMLPSRFMLFAVLCAALLAAIWLAAARARGPAWGLAVVSAALLWPALGTHAWNSAPHVPALFTSAGLRSELRANDTALLLPVGIAGQGMLWQASARLRFSQAGGYVVPPEAPDPYKTEPIYPTLTYGAPVPDELRVAREFLRSHHVTVAVLDAGGVAGSPWPGLLARLGWGARSVGGALVLRPGGLILPPAQPRPPPRTTRRSGPPAAQRAARAVVRAYFERVALGRLLAACRLLTPGARAAATQARHAAPARCAATLRPHAAPLGVVARAVRVGPAALAGRHGYVAVGPGPPLHFIPVRRLRAWRIDGPSAP